MKRTLIVGMFLLIVSGVYLYAGQWDSGNSDPYMNLRGILNPSNLQMKHSMSFMTGFSSGGDGFYRSVYTNHLFYSFHPNLDLKVDLNFVNHGTAQWNDTFSIKSNDDNASQIVPEFSLNYRPSDNTSIRIEFRSMDPYRYNYFRRW